MKVGVLGGAVEVLINSFVETVGYVDYRVVS